MISGEKEMLGGTNKAAKGTKLFLKRSSLHLRKTLDELGKEHHKSLSKIDQNLDEVRYSLKTMKLENNNRKQSKQTFTRVEPDRKASNKLQDGRVKLPAPPAVGKSGCLRSAYSMRVRRNSSFGLRSKQPSDALSKGLACGWQQRMDFADNNNVRATSGSIKDQATESSDQAECFCEVKPVAGVVEWQKESKNSCSGTGNALNDGNAEDSTTPDKGTTEDIKTTEENNLDDTCNECIEKVNSCEPSNIAEKPEETLDLVSNDKKWKTGEIDEEITKTASDDVAAHCALKWGELMKSRPRKLLARRASSGDVLNFSKTFQDGGVLSTGRRATFAEMKATRARRGSLAAMTTKSLGSIVESLQESGQTIAPAPPLNIHRSQLTTAWHASSMESLQQTKPSLSTDPAIHGSLLRIGRRMVAPMTGAQLQNRLRRHSIQHPLPVGLPAPCRGPVKVSNTTSDADLFKDLENCRYLRRVSK